MKERIIGIDVARSLAIIGMIIVNFKIAFGDHGNPFLKSFVQLFEGKAAAIFVVLAGIGIAFMSNSALANNNLSKLRLTRTKILKRALFLFVIGLLYTPIWEADILHFYGIYMLVALLVLGRSSKMVFWSGLSLVFIYPILLSVINYDINWDFQTFEYYNFWTIHGFLTNLFVNGFHPVIPWAAFMLIGLWYGKQDLGNSKFINRSIGISLSIFLMTLVLSKLSIFILAEGNPVMENDLKQILGTSPMPPLPFYMLTSGSFSIFMISLCIVLAKKFKKSPIIQLLKKTGQLALTFYVAHVVIGMMIIYIPDPTKMGGYTINFSFIYALVFSFLCIVFAHFWTKFHKVGPLEWVMRSITK
ncbi:DUF418 domain-containing protein [Flagellimonas pacifica]|uniref:Uncharacterized membrane protein YeiB n=1 Tax=Flagellimonas pacifica TaxID=1247520 RepID=A0A285MXR5_9FLAO|nr:DUF418 domain-containing protein [Allomuricauda parva]SNZ01964.1 Uncharacterized membrane protein YeiB [Allomuricauda parva]